MAFLSKYNQNSPGLNKKKYQESIVRYKLISIKKPRLGYPNRNFFKNQEVIIRSFGSLED